MKYMGGVACNNIIDPGGFSQNEYPCYCLLYQEIKYDQLLISNFRVS